MSTDPKRDRSGAKGTKTSASRARVWMAIQAWVIFGARHVLSLNRHPRRVGFSASMMPDDGPDRHRSGAFKLNSLSAN